MGKVGQITTDICGFILSEYADDPLLRVMDSSDAQTLLLGSFFIDARDHDEDIVFESSLPQLLKFFEDDDEMLDADNLSIPTALFEGSVIYSYLQATAPPPMHVSAPFHGYYTSDGHGPQTGFPQIAIAPRSFGVIFHPKLFKLIADRNPNMYEVLLTDYHRFVSMLFRWLPLPVAPLPGYRVARFLITLLPDRFEATEIVHITHVEIAKNMQLSRATIAQDIAYLFDNRIIKTGHGKITIDTKALTAFIGAH
jgi:hypothetical protein